MDFGFPGRKRRCNFFLPDASYLTEKDSDTESNIAGLSVKFAGASIYADQESG
jgi:hypothetical protein